MNLDMVIKKKLFKFCACGSGLLLLGFVCLYACVWIADPSSVETPSGQSDWRSISVGRWKILTAHSLQASREKDRPGMLTYLEDGGTNVHFSLQKSDLENVTGCYLVVHNQNEPYELNMMFGFADNSPKTNKTGFSRLGVQYCSVHSLKMFGCASNDQTSATEVLGYKTLFTKISHTVDKSQDFWTLMINLWYPIIICAVLPSIFGANKLFAKMRWASGIEQQRREGAMD